MTATVGPCHFVIFGATGDLSVNKLLPALYYLQQGGRLPDSLAFVAVSRRDWRQGQWRSFMQEQLAATLGHDYRDQDFEQFAQRFSYVRVVHEQAEHYTKLRQELSKPRQGVCANIVFYLAVSPSDFTTVVSQLDTVGLCGRLFGNRIVLEKPFGYDLDTALQLNQHLHRHFDEEQIFRIDHYLGKETVQNLLVFRFANSLVEPIWNRNYIDHVQISVAESKGIAISTAAACGTCCRNMMPLLSVEPWSLLGRGRPASKCCARYAPSPAALFALRAQ